MSGASWRTGKRTVRKWSRSEIFTAAMSIIGAALTLILLYAAVNTLLGVFFGVEMPRIRNWPVLGP